MLEQKEGSSSVYNSQMGNFNRGASFNRRDFLRLLSTAGGAAALSAFLQACRGLGFDPTKLPSPEITRHTPLPVITHQSTAHSSEPSGGPTEMTTTQALTPTHTALSGASQVAFVKTSDRGSGVRKAIELMGIDPVKGKRVFLKPNFNSADPAPGSTHLDVLTTMVAMFKEMGALGITVGDRSGMGDTRRVMQRLGVRDLAGDMEFDTLVFDELKAEEWQMFQPPGSHWERGFPFAKPCLDAEALVQTCCLKTHRYGGQFTLSLKNSVGMVAKYNQQDSYNYMNELHSSPHQRRMIAEINAAYTPDLVVMDGVEAFISGGPDRGDLVKSEVVLASTDRVALDAVGVALLRFHGCQTEVAKGRIFDQEQIARAVELGLGVDGPHKIEFITPDSESAAYAEQIYKVLSLG